MTAARSSTGMIAVVVTRRGEPPLGALEAVAECGGAAIVVDIGGLHPASTAWKLAESIRGYDVIVMPASPDGRDLAPRLAAVLGRPLLAGAVSVRPGSATVARRGGLILETHAVDGPFVATLQPGVRGVPVGLELPEPSQSSPDPAAVPTGASSERATATEPSSRAADPDVIEVTAPDSSHLDLDEAKQILAVGAGLGDRRLVELAERVAGALGMTLGATRVVTDLGWLPFERQIGTTGVMVQPDVYLAVGISGAVQHVTGLGDPGHIASINTDGSCPMATMAEVNIVCDARGVLVAMAERLGVEVDPELRQEESRG